MINELERAHEKHRDSLQEQSKLRIEAEKRYSAQAEKLSQELQDQWDNASKLGLEAEKLRRVETELRRELMQKNNTIEELKKELNNKTCESQEDIQSFVIRAGPKILRSDNEF